MTTIAAIVPVPDLDRFGYGRIAGECIASMARVCDYVYLVSSSRNDEPLSKIMWKHGNLGYISYEASWFARTPEGDEWFDAYKVMENVNLGLWAARFDGHDIAVCLMCNWHIPEWSRFREYCEEVHKSNNHWGWLHRMDQLGDVFFHASTRLPYIVNLGGPDNVRFSTDCIVVGDQIVQMERGEMSACNEVSVVDCQLEVTRDELRDKLNYIRCYHDLLPKRKALFEWPYWFHYYAEKYRAKTMAFAQQNAISALSREDFVSQMVLRAI